MLTSVAMPTEQMGLAVHEVVQEAQAALGNYGPQMSTLEGFAIILKQVDDLRAQVFTKAEFRDHAAMRREAKQVAASALRFMVDVSSGVRG